MANPGRSVTAKSPEQLLELAQEYIRPLIEVIDQLNEADAEDERQVISKQLARLCFRVRPPSPKSRSARQKKALPKRGSTSERAAALAAARRRRRH